MQRVVRDSQKGFFEAVKSTGGSRIIKELGKNALTVEVPFSGGNGGCLVSVYSAVKYLAEAGVAWDVPESEGVYPIFEANASEDTRKGQFLPTLSARRASRPQNVANVS